MIKKKHDEKRSRIKTNKYILHKYAIYYLQKIDFNNINVTVILLRKKYFSYDIKGFDGRYRISDWLSISLKQVLYVKNRCTFGLIECCNISGG